MLELEVIWGFPRIDATFLPPTGDDFRLGTEGEFLPCWDDNVEAWPALLAVEVEAVVLGLPPALFDIEVVGELTIIGGDGDWLLLGGCCPCAVDDFVLAANDICPWLCWVLPCC